MDDMIQIDNLTKVYRAFKGAKEVRALDQISFAASRGEFIGIMGPSGSGKTTLLNILSGVDTSTSGEVIIEGQSIARLKKDKLALFRRQRIGYIFQDFNLLDSLTLKENIALPLILDHVAPQQINSRVDELMQFFGIADIAGKYPYHVSGGQKQRTAAARALVTEPAVVFADEPTGNLDSKSASDIMDMLTEMNERKNSTILMVTHDAFAASYCKRIIFIKDGQISVQIQRAGDRKAFFDKILEILSVMRGDAQ
ncbi:putative ABC transport system ATP-binding protein [Paenibacillus cellulosilyticus]|uniref:Putative ABC transport system ATP-binding protein n=1 Tax=Paenibacillus cellulosilyticus TaxID=375489 RepID=A0A2V2YZ87_9BACL|nr:ABC transporter ATP-binding protein [Paenibacillus cellulosilyticus]PWW05174.1 putative ABC transport system ATP-binding protein [Paenibacillus cellulosilyticus]